MTGAWVLRSRRMIVGNEWIVGETLLVDDCQRKSRSELVACSKRPRATRMFDRTVRARARAWL